MKNTNILTVCLLVTYLGLGITSTVLIFCDPQGISQEDKKIILKIDSIIKMIVCLYFLWLGSLLSKMHINVKVIEGFRPIFGLLINALSIWNIYLNFTDDYDSETMKHINWALWVLLCLLSIYGLDIFKPIYDFVFKNPQLNSN